jgi:hypothetical protein
MDKDVVLPLAKAVPVEVEPAIEIRYEVDEVTTIEAGIVNVTRSVLPNSGCTAVAWVIPDGPTPDVDGCNLTVTFAGGMVPLGKP